METEGYNSTQINLYHISPSCGGFQKFLFQWNQITPLPLAMEEFHPPSPPAIPQPPPSRLPHSGTYFLLCLASRVIHYSLCILLLLSVSLTWFMFLFYRYPHVSFCTQSWGELPYRVMSTVQKLITGSLGEEEKPVLLSCPVLYPRSLLRHQDTVR